MVDALYNLSVPEALALARAIDPFDIHFFEAPFRLAPNFDLVDRTRNAWRLDKGIALGRQLGDRTCARRR